MEFRNAQRRGKDVEQLPEGCISNHVLKGMADGKTYPPGSSIYNRNWPHASTCQVEGDLNCTERYNGFADVNTGTRSVTAEKDATKQGGGFLGRLFGRSKA
jgi:hypothetical protein